MAVVAVVKQEIKQWWLVDARLVPPLHTIHVDHIDLVPDLERYDDDDNYCVVVFVVDVDVDNVIDAAAAAVDAVVDNHDDVNDDNDAYAGPGARRSILNLVAFSHDHYQVNCLMHLHWHRLVGNLLVWCAMTRNRVS